MTKEVEVTIGKSIEDEINEVSVAELKKQLKKTGKNYISNPLGTLKKYCKRKDVDVEVLIECKKFIDEVLEKNKEKRKEQIMQKIAELQSELEQIS